jgi:hypothetical protein
MTDPSGQALPVAHVVKEAMEHITVPDIADLYTARPGPAPGMTMPGRGPSSRMDVHD